MRTASSEAGSGDIKFASCAVAYPASLPKWYGMKQSDLFRENAENCMQLAERADGIPAVRRFSRMAQAWGALAHEQDWLDGKIPPCIEQPRRT